MNEEHSKILGLGVRVWNQWRRTVSGQSPDLSHIELANKDLSGVDFSNADLSHATLFNCYLDSASFEHSKCWYASFRKSVMHSVDMRNADMSHADFVNSHFADHQGNSRASVAGATFLLARFTSEEESLAEGSFLDLAMCEGLTDAHFGNDFFVHSYLERAFTFAHKSCIAERNIYPHLVSRAMDRMRSLITLMTTESPPPALVEVSDLITLELLLFLRKHPSELYRVGSRQFEYIVAEILASFGWNVQVTPKTKDGGYDIFAITKDLSGVSSSWIVECKRYKPELKVGIEIARALYTVKGEMRVANAMLATTSSFTRGVEEFSAARFDFNLKDFGSVLDWLNTYRPNPNGRLYISDKYLFLKG